MKVEVTLIIDVPEVDSLPTQKQIEDWVEFQLGYSAGLSSNNPLYQEDIHGNVDECYFVSFTT